MQCPIGDKAATMMIPISNHLLRRQQAKSTSTTTMSKFFLSTSNNKTRRRRKPSLRAPTTKDRIRRRQRTIGDSTSPISKQNVELLTERMVTRLEWIQKSLKNYLPSSESLLASPTSSSSTSNQATKVAAAATTTTSDDPPRRLELVMDSNWWIWNIILAMTPGVLIAIGCEFYVKPQMIELHLEKGGGIEIPPQLTWKESLEQMTPNSIQSILLQTSPKDSKPSHQDNKNSSSQSTSTNQQKMKGIQQDQPNDDPLLLEFQELKEKLQELELKIDNNKNLPQKKNKSEIWKRHHHPLEEKRTTTSAHAHRPPDNNLDKQPSATPTLYPDFSKGQNKIEPSSESSTNAAFSYILSLSASTLQKIGTLWNKKGSSPNDETTAGGETISSTTKTSSKTKKTLQEKMETKNLEESAKPSSKDDGEPERNNVDSRIKATSDDSDDKANQISDYRDRETKKSRSSQWWKLG